MIANLLNIDVDAELARRSLLDFMQYTWYKSEPFIIGRHTEDICNRIDAAIERFAQGKSSFLIITMPPRHGKSEIVSRMLPAYFLGRYPDYEVFLTSYSADLLRKFSYDTRGKIMPSKAYNRLWPQIQLSKNKSDIRDWAIESKNPDETYSGHVQYAGLTGGISGSGYHLGILDDYLKNREDAESDVIRNKLWEEFTNSFFTRRAPVSITIVLATRWHTDDIIGRLLKNKTKFEQEFEIDLINYPAKSRDYEEGYLFPERFSPEYYEGEYIILGSYAAAALLDCNPVVKGGNRFRIGNAKIISEGRLPEGLKWIRAWDLASSKKERSSDDPDYTAGVLMAVEKIEQKTHSIPRYKLYIRDMVRIQQEAPERNRLIVRTAERDGQSVRLAIESVAGYKDAYNTLREMMKGVRVVHKVTTTSDKEVRAAPLEPLFEAGDVYLVRGAWNREFIREFAQFPGGAHDDQVDAVSTGWHQLTKKAIVY
jgi:predicted phage terminase large subunit-like protein